METRDTADDGSSQRRLADRVTALADTLRTGSITDWILVSGQRGTVALVLLTGVFFAFFVFALLRPLDMEYILSDTSALRTLFATLLSGAILIVSIVSSISSIVLSQEITDIETERERIDATIDFRSRTAELTDLEGSPSQPAAFLEVILYSIYRETQHLQSVADQSGNREFDDEIETLASEITSEAKNAAVTLDGAKFGTFKVLSAGLNYDYSWQLNTARRIQNQHADDLSEEEMDALEGLIDTLKFFATGRQYFQSLYYKREVARLSSTLLYVSLPVIVFISYLLLALDTSFVPDLAVGPLSSMSIFVLFAYTVSLAPYVVLTAYVIRVGAITMQTLAAGPFTIRQPDHEEIVEVEMDTDPHDWQTDFDDADDGESDDGGEADW